MYSYVFPISIRWHRTKKSIQIKRRVLQTKILLPEILGNDVSEQTSPRCSHSLASIVSV
jgi:hypothetical protein